MKILSCLLILMCFFECSCSKATNPAVEFCNKVAHSPLSMVWKAPNPAVEFCDKAVAAYREKNYKEAFKWYKKSAELGNSMAMHNLGVMYDEGEGTLRDDKEAFKWYKKADFLNHLKLTELGDATAMYNLGLMYYHGEGTLKDPQQAKYWIKKAYDAGDKDAEETWNTLELWKY